MPRPTITFFNFKAADMKNAANLAAAILGGFREINFISACKNHRIWAKSTRLGNLILTAEYDGNKTEEITQ